MTHEMLRKARANAVQGGYPQVEFRLGEIEHLPVADAIVDVIISNCVINLSPEKAQVFREAFRVLKHGGRLAVSDVVATAPFPDEVQHDLALRAGCVAGASFLDDLEGMLRDVGFVDIRIQPKDESKTFIREWVPGTNIADYLISATIEAVKLEGALHPCCGGPAPVDADACCVLDAQAHAEGKEGCGCNESALGQ
jgi:SAM-dependent methyltransferase